MRTRRQGWVGFRASAVAIGLALVACSGQESDDGGEGGAGGGVAAGPDTCFYRMTSTFRCNGDEPVVREWPGTCEKMSEEECALEHVGNSGYVDGCVWETTIAEVEWLSESECESTLASSDPNAVDVERGLD